MDKNTPAPQLSIVIPIYNEEKILIEMKRRLDSVLQSLSISYQIIFVDDGSCDTSLDILNNFIQCDQCVVVAKLSRNFGHQSAITAGISLAEGEVLIIMDGDLEDPPEMIPELIAKWKTGDKVVLALRQSRKGSFIKKILFNTFYKVFSFFSDLPIPINSGIFCLMDKKVYSRILDFSERNRFIPGLRAWLGFQTSSIWYDRQPRYSGKPKQTFWRLLKYAADAIFSFSYKPLRLSFFLGLIISLSSSTYAVILIFLRLLNINVTSGFTTIAVSVFFFGGALLVSNGIIGEYLGRIYDEVKRRPLFIIDEIYKNKFSELTSHDNKTDQ